MFANVSGAYSCKVVIGIQCQFNLCHVDHDHGRIRNKMLLERDAVHLTGRLI